MLLTKFVVKPEFKLKFYRLKTKLNYEIDQYLPQLLIVLIKNYKQLLQLFKVNEIK